MSTEGPKTSFDLHIAHTVAEFGEETWNRLGAGQPFASYRWYRFAEEVLVDDTPLYVLLSANGQPVARAALRLTWQEPVPIDFPPLRAAIIEMLRRRPLMLCQTPFVGTSSLILPGPPLRDPALRTIAEAVKDQARQHRASFIAFAYLEEHEAHYPGWPRGFAAVELPEPATRLDIEWPDFESYVSDLSRKRRKHYRQRCRTGEEMGVEITIHPRVTDVDTALTLIRNVEKKYNAPPVPWNRSLLEHADMVDAAWVAARVDDRLVGCELMIGDRDSWRVMALGRDYDFHTVYFLLGYADIRHAIECGAKDLRWGNCTYDAKRRLGFELGTNNYAVFAANGWLLERLGRWIAAREERKVEQPCEEED